MLVSFFGGMYVIIKSRVVIFLRSTCLFFILSLFFNLIYTYITQHFEWKTRVLKVRGLFVTVGLAHDKEHAYHEQGLKYHAVSIIEEYPRVWIGRKKPFYRSAIHSPSYPQWKYSLSPSPNWHNKNQSTEVLKIDWSFVALCPFREYLTHSHMRSHHFRWRVAKINPKININHLLVRHTLFQTLKSWIKGVIGYSACHPQAGWLLLHAPLISTNSHISFILP